MGFHMPVFCIELLWYATGYTSQKLSNFILENCLPGTYCIQGKFHPVLFSPFSLALWPEGEFNTGLMELYIKDYIRKFDSGRIQDCVNQFQNIIGRKKDWANSKLYTVYPKMLTVSNCRGQQVNVSSWCYWLPDTKLWMLTVSLYLIVGVGEWMRPRDVTGCQTQSCECWLYLCI